MDATLRPEYVLRKPFAAKCNGFRGDFDLTNARIITKGFASLYITLGYIVYIKANFKHTFIICTITLYYYSVAQVL